MKLTFSSIKNGKIFEPEFQHLTDKNGTVEFKHMRTAGGIAVVYAPNGTGKSSLTKVLSAESTTEKVSFTAKDETGRHIKPESLAFHIIQDQINRNMIRGKETDYLVGRQIRREYELRDSIDAAFSNAFDALIRVYKNDFKICKVGDFILTQIGELTSHPYPTAFAYLRSIINTKDHGKSIEQNQFISFIRGSGNTVFPASLDSDKRSWVISDCSRKGSICERIIGLNYRSIVPNMESVQIEQYDDAISILKKYHSLDRCIVCDNPDFNGDDLLERKSSNRKRIYDGLDQHTKDLLDKIVCDQSLDSFDPFEIKKTVRNFIAEGNAIDFHQLQLELTGYVHSIGDEMIQAMVNCFSDTQLFKDYAEYSKLVETKPQLDSEELMFIENVINESIEKDITIEREPNSKNYKLKLGGKDLLNTDRNDMELSSGEQNFISLTFELLYARHSDKKYVILDDPISSFDSVYKNKIAYCIIKFLENKQQIVLTHNTDLIRLLDVQLNNCFNLYILNNVENGKNGFIAVSEKEKNLLINMHELIKLFQNKNGTLRTIIKSRRQFLMSMVPFMRGYAHISLDREDDFGTLSKIMHGYGTGSVNVVPIYKRLFGYDFGSGEIISVKDILNLDCEKLEILDKTEYPLLADTLEQTLVYYHLRMKVEKELVVAFGIEAHEMDTLNQIIQKAFRSIDSDPDFERKREFRVFFTSRKTLLNEFNHFEGNMNIFQPAIDITRTALRKEIFDIESKLVEVRIFVNAQSV